MFYCLLLLDLVLVIVDLLDLSFSILSSFSVAPKFHLLQPRPIKTLCHQANSPTQTQQTLRQASAWSWDFEDCKGLHSQFLDCHPND